MAADARHYCDYPSCDKSFRRMEHLKRHQLNHTNRTIQCPKCSRIFYRNDLLQRHLTLKHRRGQRKSVSLEESSLNRDFPLDPGSSNRQNENLTSNTDCEPLGSAEHALQNTHLTQGGSGISPLSSLSSDQPDLLMIRSPVPFSPFTLENNGHNYNWAYQPSSDPASSSAIHGLETNHNLSQNPASHDALFEPVILQEFYLTPETHQELLSLIPVGNGSSLNTLDEFIRVLDMAVSRLADSLPILHRPTLNFEFLHRELSASILCFGLLASDQPDFHEIGCSLLHRLREDIILFTHNNTITMEQVWVLQAMLILEFGGMFYANRKAMELSDIFHGTMVTLARRLGIFEPSYEPARPSSSLSHDTRWLEWIHKESLKRLAYFIFVLDVKHALLFGHDRSIFSVFAIKLDLPCDNREWGAVGAHEWNAVIPSLVSGRLKCHEIHNTLLFSQEPDVDLPYLDALGAYIVFAGLSSITMDFLQRHHEPFFDRDKAIRRLCHALSAIHERLSSTPESKVKDHAQMIYYVSLISLYTPLDDLERAANSGYSLTGLTPKQQTRSAIVRLLTRNKVEVKSARHATCLLRIYIPEDLRISSPYESSGLYLATLTLWAYLTGKGYDHESPMLPSNNTDIEALNAMEISLEDSDMAACGKHWRTLVQHVADRLGKKYNENAREYSQVLHSLIDITI